MRLLPRYPGVLALAFILAFTMWYARALERRERVSERQLEASLTFVNAPTDMVITSETPRALLVRVRGTLRRLMALESSQTGVILDLRGIDEGEHELVVESRDVVVPTGVEVIAVIPSQVPIRLEKLIRRRVPIRPRLSGEPPEPWRITSVRAEPAQATVVGPREQVEALQAVATDPIGLDAAMGPVEVVVGVRSPHPLTRIETPLTVRVTVDMEEPEAAPAGERRR